MNNLERENAQLNRIVDKAAKRGEKQSYQEIIGLLSRSKSVPPVRNASVSPSAASQRANKIDLEQYTVTSKKRTVELGDPKAGLKSMISERHKERRDASVSKSQERSYELYQN